MTPPHNIDAAAAALAELPAAARMLVTGEIVRPPDAVAAVADAAATMTTSSSAAADAALGAGGEATAFVTALAPKVDRATEGFSIFRGVVSRAQACGRCMAAIRRCLTAVVRPAGSRKRNSRVNSACRRSRFCR